MGDGHRLAPKSVSAPISLANADPAIADDMTPAIDRGSAPEIASRGGFAMGAATPGVS